MKKRRVLLICTILIVALLLSACGTQVVTETPIEDEDVVTIKYMLWGDGSRYALTTSTISNFEKNNPGIKIELDYRSFEEYDNYLEECLENGTEADVIQLNYAMFSRHRKGGEEFYNMYQSKEELNVASIANSYLDLGIVYWKLNALPVSVDANVFVYNQTLLQSMGEAVPTDFEGMETLAATLAKDGKYLLGLKSSELVTFLFSYFEQRTNKVIKTREGLFTFRNNDLSEFLDDYVRFVDSHIILPPGEYSDEAFAEERVVGSFCLITELEEMEALFRKARGTSVVGDFPVLSEAGRFGYYAKPDYLLAVGKHSEHPKEATRFLDYLVNDKENAKIQGTDKGIPVSTAAEMGLMEIGKMNTLSYQGKLYLDFYHSQMSQRPWELEELSFADEFVKILEQYRTGEIGLGEAIIRLSNLTNLRG